MVKALEKEVEMLRERVSILEAQSVDSEAKYFRDKVTKLEAKLDHVTAEYESLIQSYLDAQRQAFGKKSERFVDSNQMPLFESETVDPKSNDVASKAAKQDVEEITYTRKKRKSRQADLDALPQREEIIVVDEADRTCLCGDEKQLVGYEEKRTLNYKPATFEVINQKREILGCKKGCEKSMVTAPLPKKILPKCKASDSLLSYIAISKVLDRQPLYHLENKIEREHHWKIPRQTMARWMIQMSERLQPLVNLMKDEILNYDIAAIDATTLQVLNEPGRPAETKSQAYCIRGGPPDKQVSLFEYNGYYRPREYTQSDYVVETLTDFKGKLSCDASPVFDEIGKLDDVTLSYCHAHARRKFEAIEKMRNKRKGKKSNPGLAHYVMKSIYQPLYQIEKKIKNAKETMHLEAITAYRQEHSKPILDAWYDWLVEHKELTLKESPIGKAIRYTLNNWIGLQTYLTDGRVEIDNNSCERDIKPFVIARKNFLFACTQAGADSLGVHFSLILTAKHHGWDPYRYYCMILKQVPFCDSLADYSKLLPWNLEK